MSSYGKSVYLTRRCLYLHTNAFVGNWTLLLESVCYNIRIALCMVSRVCECRTICGPVPPHAKILQQKQTAPVWLKCESSTPVVVVICQYPTKVELFTFDVSFLRMFQIVGEKFIFQKNMCSAWGQCDSLTKKLNWALFAIKMLQKSSEREWFSVGCRNCQFNTLCQWKRRLAFAAAADC